MLDGVSRRLLDPPLNQLARVIARTGITANALTLVGFLLGLLVLIALAKEQYHLALGLILGNRLLDGLDGAVARHNGVTDLGGFFDIVGDFIFFGAVALGFALANEEQNAVAAAFLLFSFVGTEASFLAYAAVAEKRHMTTDRVGTKSFYFIDGLVEGTETVLLYILACLKPEWFVWIAVLFGVLCWMTTSARIVVAWFTFRD